VSSAPTIKAALVTALRALFAEPVLVSYGIATVYQPDDIIAVTDVATTAGEITMAPIRRREEEHDITVMFSSYTGVQDQQIATERTYAMLAVFEAWLVTDSGITINGTCRKAVLTSHELSEETDTDVLTNGRVAEIRATVTCQSRY